MKKYLLRFLLFASLTGITSRLQAQNTLSIGAGAQLVCTGPVSLSLTDLNQLTNHGSFSAGTGTVIIKSAAQPILLGGNGNSSLTFHNLSLDNMAGARLGQSLIIGHQLTFLNGNLDLKGNNIELSDSASLTGESETSRLFDDATTPGHCSITQYISLSPNTQPGGLGVEIDNTSTAPGITTLTRYTGPPAGSTIPSELVQRYYLITPATNTHLGATTRFYYLDAELKGVDPLTAVLWKSTDNGTTWAAIPPDARDTAAKYLLKNNIDDFSLWALGAPGNPLPLLFTFFSSTCTEKGTWLQWTTAQQVNTEWFYIEKSTDGVTFNDFQRIPATGTGGTYSYTDKNAGPASYRIKEVDMDGGSVYSPITHSNCEPAGVAPQLYPNPAPGYTYIVFTATEGYQSMISVYDETGKIVRNIPVTATTGPNNIRIDLSGLTSGVYIISMRTKDSNINRQVKVL
ncbi:MAG TPA: T9SS type A sorting domain-containing protein [Puia sp.]|jgi:hypothetical protein